ncbi:MAG: hypothetical protein NTZ61_00055, partial [Proteobacteria bacterium]|nr:hypothetical protein [Pseudomonadota bacterium]
MILDSDRGRAGISSVPAFADGLARVVSQGAAASVADAHALIRCHDDDLPLLLAAAGRLRDQ